MTAIRALSAGHLRHRLVRVYSAGIPAGEVVNWSPQGRDVAPGTVVTVWVSKGPAPRPVPTLSSRDTYAEAKQLLEGSGFKVVKATGYSLSVPVGYVISASPSGVQSYGTTVTVTVSLGPKLVVIPGNLAGDTLQQVTGILHGLGLRVASYGPGDIVVYTDPAGGLTVPQDTLVSVYTI